MREAERDSRVSPFAPNAGEAPFEEGRRVTAELSEDGTRGEAAERAVAPLAMGGGGGLDAVDGEVRLEPGGVAREEAVVAIGLVPWNGR